MFKSEPTVVFLPGMLNTGEIWTYQEKIFNRRYNIVHGDVYTDTSLENMARRILGAITGQLVILGLSMGGYCALEIFKQAPDRIEKMVLFNTAARSPTKQQKSVRQRLIAQSYRGQFIGVGERMLDSLLGDVNRDNHKLRAKIRQMALKCGRDVYVRQQTAIINRQCYLSLLKDIHIPVLCIAGQQDRITPPEYLQEIYRHIEGAQYVELKGCGHLTPMEFSEKSNIIVKNWLKI